VTFSAAGTYYWQATYSGDSNNASASSPCTSETLTVGTASPAIGTKLSASSISVGGSASDSATLTSATASAGGTVTYTVYTDDECTVLAAYQPSPATVTVSDGTVPDSAAVTFSAAGTYYWQATYSGDSNNASASSPCTSETLTVVQPGRPNVSITKLVNGSPSANVTGGQSSMLTYTIQVANSGDAATASDYTVTDNGFPAFFTGSPTITCALNGGPEPCTYAELTGSGIDLGVLQPSDTWLITVSGSATPNTGSDVSTSPHLNTAAACPVAEDPTVSDAVPLAVGGDGCLTSSASVTVVVTPPSPTPTPTPGPTPQAWFYFTKTVTGNLSGWTGGSFSFTVTCDGQTSSVTLPVSASGGTVESRVFGPYVGGVNCSVAEGALPSAGPNASWGSPAYSPSASVYVVTNTSTVLNVTNTRIVTPPPTPSPTPTPTPTPTATGAVKGVTSPPSLPPTSTMPGSEGGSPSGSLLLLIGALGAASLALVVATGLRGRLLERIDR
jgi:plastocyanin